MKNFDEAYAGYLAALKKLDQTDEIAEKNLLFRQLTQQLSDLEQRLRIPSSADDDADDLFTWDSPAHGSGSGSVPTSNI